MPVFAVVLLYILIALWVADATAYDNRQLPPYIDRRSPAICGCLWPVYLACVLIAATSRRLLGHRRA